jgi:ketosteroid isomerase-like protein
MKKIILSALVASTLFACKETTVTKPEFDLVNAKKEIQIANETLTNALAKGDSVTVGNFYTTDAKFLDSNMPAVVGRAKIQNLWAGYINMGATKLKLTTLEVWGNENIITEEGTYDFKSNTDKPMGIGKYLAVWKKEDGKWKLHRDMPNSDLPLSKE